MSPRPTLFSVGHSTRSVDEIVELLEANGVERVVDVRAYPGSRRYPHVASDVMAGWLNDNGIDYRHLPALGGRRRPVPGSPNTAWTNKQFQGYADHMSTPEFAGAMRELLDLCARARTACMCAEAQWWRCHRRMICDAAVVAGHPARHIMSVSRSPMHELTAFAMADDGQLSYPSAAV